MIQNMRNNQKGFTLIELMIVVAIIGILAAIAIPQFGAYRIRAFNSAATSDVVNIQKSEAAFFADNQRFGYSATAANTPAVLTGPGNANTGIASATAYMQIGMSNGVTLNAVIDANGTAFNAAAKHLQGNRRYAVDSDVTATYSITGVASTAVGQILVAADVPAAVAGADELAATYTAM